MTNPRQKPPVEPLDEVHLARRYLFPFFAPPAPREPRSNPLMALLSAFQSLSRRGVGPHAFGTSFAESPLAFILDTMQDAVLVRRRDGSVLYRNRAAEALAPTATGRAVHRFTQDGIAYERRCMRYLEGDRQIVIEIVSRR